jgi:hypothetical protein
MKQLLPYLAILALLLFVFNRECTRPGSKPPNPDTVTIIKVVPGDSIPYPVVIPTRTPVHVYHDTGSTRWRNLPIDTMAILKDYYSIYFYDDTLMNDTSAFIRLQSHTIENKLHYGNLFFQNKRAKQIITTITPQAPERNKLYLGLGVNFLPDSPGLSGNVLLTTKSKMAVSAGYDFNNRMLMAAGYYKIQFRRTR